jgi:hypothetical protein
MYSLIWMPLLVLMCLTRMGRGSSPSSSSSKAAAAADGRNLPAGSVLQQQQQQQAAGLAGYGSLHPAGSGGAQFLDGGASAFSSGSTAAAVAAARRRTATASGSLDLPPRYSVPGSFGRGGYGAAADDGDGSSMRSAASGRSLRQALNSGYVRGSAGPLRASSDRLHMSRPSKMLQGAASLPPHNSSSSGGVDRAGFSRQRTMPMPNRAGQGLNARLSYTGGDYGSGSPRGFDVRAADQHAAAGLAANSSSSTSSQYLAMRKGNQGQQQGPADTHFVHDDAAAAADAVAA